MRIRQLKRTAIIVKPREPYIQWANSLDDGGVKLGEDFEPEHTVYLIEAMADYEVDIEAMIEPHHKFIFEEELNEWHGRESDWPVKRDLATFLEWFEVAYHSVIIDLCPGRVKTERYERY